MEDDDDPILQERLPDLPWADPSFRRLPGTRPVGADDWVFVDDAYARQMALRERFLDARRPEVLALLPEGAAAAAEFLDLVLGTIARRPGFAVARGSVTRPDGATVGVDRADPLGTVGRVLQEDACLLVRQGAEHVLAGAVLVFPSGWTLAQKIGRPLPALHGPVAEYGPDMARRVDRLFDGLRPGRPLMRANVLWYGQARLHAPRREGVPRPPATGNRLFVRSERQCLVRLPVTGATVFTIHTTIVDADRLDPGVRAALEHRPD